MFRWLIQNKILMTLAKSTIFPFWPDLSKVCQKFQRQGTNNSQFCYIHILRCNSFTIKNDKWKWYPMEERLVFLWHGLVIHMHTHTNTKASLSLTHVCSSSFSSLRSHWSAFPLCLISFSLSLTFHFHSGPFMPDFIEMMPAHKALYVWLYCSAFVHTHRYVYSFGTWSWINEEYSHANTHTWTVIACVLFSLVSQCRHHNVSSSIMLVSFMIEM